MGIAQNKYIRTEDGQIIIFPVSIEHSTFKSLKPITAGFCTIMGSEVVCLGESISLDLKSDETLDSLMATYMLFGININE